MVNSGVCDLVLLESPAYGNGLGLSIHIRTKAEAFWSYIESAVVRIGEQMIELKGGVEQNEGPHYWINGHPGDQADPNNDPNLLAMVAELRTVFPKFDIHYQKKSAKQHLFRLDNRNFQCETE